MKPCSCHQGAHILQGRQSWKQQSLWGVIRTQHVHFAAGRSWALLWVGSVWAGRVSFRRHGTIQLHEITSSTTAHHKAASRNIPNRSVCYGFLSSSVHNWIILWLKSVEWHVLYVSMLGNGLPQWLSSKESDCNAGATGVMGSIPGSGRSPGEGHGNPLQYSCQENPMDRGAWLTTDHGVTKSWTRLKRLNMHACNSILKKLYHFIFPSTL